MPDCVCTQFSPDWALRAEVERQYRILAWLQQLTSETCPERIRACPPPEWTLCAEVERQYRFLAWLEQVALDSVYPGAPFPRKVMGLSAMRLILTTRSQHPCAALPRSAFLQGEFHRCML